MQEEYLKTLQILKLQKEKLIKDIKDDKTDTEKIIENICLIDNKISEYMIKINNEKKNIFKFSDIKKEDNDFDLNKDDNNNEIITKNTKKRIAKKFKYNY